MLIKFAAILIVLIGAAGLVLPIVPGILLIIIGILIFFNDRPAAIRRLLPEKIPSAAAVIYSLIIPKILSSYYKMIADEIALVPGGRLLDIGTGPGILAIKISSKFSASLVTGIDLSEKMIGIANENRVKGQGSMGRVLSNVEFRVMDAKKLDFPDELFDMIISTGSFHHWKEPVRIFDEIHRCLKNGGEAWIYDGYGDATKDDIARCIDRVFKILPTYSMVRCALGIHGYNHDEYKTMVLELLRKSRFKEGVLEPRGIMMRIRLRKCLTKLRVAV